MPVINGTEFDDLLVGTEDDDVISGLGGNDTIDAAGGNDTIEGGAGNDAINAGAGDDVILYRVADAPGRGDGADAIDGGDGDDRVQIIGVAGAWQSIQFVLTMTPSGLSIFRWNSGPNNSTTLANVEAVTADFAASPDLHLSYAGSPFDIAVDLSAGTATGLGSIVGVKNVIAGRANDTIVGDAQSNWLRGEGGDDTLHGGDGNDELRGDFFPSVIGPGLPGNDALFGGDGDDILWGGAGVDTHDGGEGFDRVSFYDLKATQGAVASLLTQTISNDGFGNAETMVSIEALGSGTAYADWFEGDNSANLLWGGIGDTLFGLGGDDEFYLEGAAALIDGGEGVDTLLSFTGYLNGALTPDATGDGLAEVIFPTHGVDVDLSLNAIVDDGFGNSGTIVSVENVGGSDLGDTLIGNDVANALRGLGGDDTLNGGAGDDTLEGGDGMDTINGGAGADAVVGGGGDDTLRGGAQSDVFVFDPSSGQDTVSDFDANPGGGQDFLDISAFGVSSVDFSARVSIVDLGADTLITIDGATSVLLQGVNGNGPNIISQSDFILGGG